MRGRIGCYNDLIIVSSWNLAAPDSAFAVSAGLELWRLGESGQAPYIEIGMIVAYLFIVLDFPRELDHHGLALVGMDYIHVM
jgi:hypothetical protein